MKKPFEQEVTMWEKWNALYKKMYEEVPYNSNFLVTHANDSGHKIIEKKFTPQHHFSRVLEVGASTGYHLKFVQSSFDEYIISDISENLLQAAKKEHGDKKGVSIEKQDACALTYPDCSIDRLISIYNLEHLPNPHNVLKEWHRVIKPGGIISISLPCDGGVAWRLGRYLTTRRAFAAQELNLDYIIAREHINPTYNLISLIRHHFKNIDETYSPLRVPLLDINLVYCCNIRV